ncbi:MAG: HAD-IC family P-type ATPase, partial [Rhodococcus sp. (in: high G+C Gram-positive bacteria)]
MSDACGCGPDEPRPEGEEEREPDKLWQVTEIRAAAVAGVLLVAGLIVEWTDGPHPAALTLFSLALLVAGYTFVPATLKRLARGKIGVGTLMTIAAVGAVLLGKVEEAAMLAFLFAISEGLEEFSVTRTRRGLRALLSLVPATATVVRGGREQIIEPGELQPGEIMIVKPGERIATDGTIATGRTALDVSAITGESVPVEAGPGDDVFAGSINGTGVLEVEVTAGAQDNSLAKIVRIVEAEQSRKGEAQRLADTVAKPLVPAILVVAALIAAVGSLLGEPRVWIERALVVLVAASPCALAIAVPVTVFAAVGAASKIGVLVKGGAALEALGRIRGIALDKTGTLTRNRPTVIAVATAAGVTRDEVLEVAAALEARSEHPLAKAILAAVDDITAAENVEAVTGAGLT